MLPPVGPIGSGQHDVRGQLVAAALEKLQAQPACGVLMPPVKSRPVCIIWCPVSCTAAAVWYTLRTSENLSAELREQREDLADLEATALRR